MISAGFDCCIFPVTMKIQSFSDEEVAEYREAFSILDKDSSNSITEDELGVFVRNLGGNMTKAKLKGIIDEVWNSTSFIDPCSLCRLNVFNFWPPNSHRLLNEAKARLDRLMEP